jgi:hypothetical protein
MFYNPAIAPRGIKSRGDFKLVGSTGSVTVVTGGAAHDIVSFRWASILYDCVIWYVRWKFYVTTGFTAGQEVQHSLYRARGWSVSPSGSTSLLPAVGEQMKNPEMADSALTAFQISAAAEIVTPGTRTLDALPLMTRGLWCPTTTIVEQTEASVPPDGYLLYLHAPIAALGQGFVLQNDITMGAAGVIKLNFEVAWSEVALGSLRADDSNYSGSYFAGQ